SEYYHYFDIDWDHPQHELKGKLMVPFLGDELQVCLDKEEVKLAFSGDGFTITYADMAWPLSLPCYELLQATFREIDPQTTIPSILLKMTAAAQKVNRQTWSGIRKQFLAAVTGDPAHVEITTRVVTSLNSSRPALEALLAQQYYRLTSWKETENRINYRRFFTVNELICLRMEDPEVFEEYHAGIVTLLKERIIQGLRIDHIDGLQDPANYTQALRALAGDSCYIIAEKILEAKEDMPAQWPLQGTSGYEFLSFLNQLLTLRTGARRLLAFYRDLIPGMPSYDKLIFESKRLILGNYMRGEWDNITHLLVSLNLADGFDPERMRTALGFFMLSLPVYRLYPESLPLKGKNLVIAQEAFDKALSAGSDYSQEINHLRNLFTEAQPEARALPFLKRLMQFTGPLTAKGVEDTTFYIYNPLISHDEVGDSPGPLGMSIQRFHEKMQKRQAATPLSLNATATHDTKRGEDARVRINVLSRIPELWIQCVGQWLEINRPCRSCLDGRPAPGLNDEYFIYQSILGGFPEDFQVTEEFILRVQAYLNKALREAKVNTNWSEPDEQYEKACERFVRQILNTNHAFLSSFLPFLKIVCEHAMVYSLSQTLIKLTAPGIPDIYQGCELWDLSFVDPDNRRPVDFDKRMEYLFQLVLREEKGKEALFEYLRQHHQAGIEKLYITWKTLNYRKTHPDLFIAGDYIPLDVTGQQEIAVAYARRRETSWAMVIVPLGLVKREMDSTEDFFSSQHIVLPDDAPERWLNLFTGDTHASPNQISLSEIFRDFPVALLVGL
ncbi:MAG TPA: malto-oligosyltrehalose synthase, partial [Chryseosolibacter sp.]